MECAIPRHRTAVAVSRPVVCALSGHALPFGSAGDVQSILGERGLPRPARIISGLPFASLPAFVQDAVVDGLVWALQGSACDFRTFQYVHAYRMKAARRFRARMAERFEHVERIGPIVRNVPPAFVLRYHGVK